MSRTIPDPITGRPVPVRPIVAQAGGPVVDTLPPDAVEGVKGPDGVWRARLTDADILAILNDARDLREDAIVRRATAPDGSAEARACTCDLLRASAAEYDALAARADNTGQPDRAAHLRREARECRRLASA